MAELWDVKKCRTCGKAYHFGDGPKCKCPNEKMLHAEEHAEAMKEWDFIGESKGGKK